MEFNLNRGSQPAAARPAAQSGAAATTGGVKPPHKAVMESPRWLRVVWVVLLFAITVLVIAIAFLLYFGGPKQSGYVSTKEEQAVFLTNGQVYFGKIKEINKEYINMTGIYYLNVNQQVQPNQKSSTSSSSNTSNSVSLVKLGCELHGPTDQMLINQSQVTFWENLKTDGQVAQAIAKWQQQNPKGQTCSTSTGSNSTPTSANP